MQRSATTLPGPIPGVDLDHDAHVAPDSIDTRARTALTLGLLSFLFNVLAGIPAIWVGRKALEDISSPTALSRVAGRLDRDRARLPECRLPHHGLDLPPPARVSPYEPNHHGS